MPFESEAQRKFMWAKHPKIAKRWAHEGKNKGLPKHKKKSGSKGHASYGGHGKVEFA